MCMFVFPNVCVNHVFDICQACFNILAGFAWVLYVRSVLCYYQKFWCFFFWGGVRFNALFICACFNLYWMILVDLHFFLNFVVVICCFAFSSCDLFFSDVLCIHGLSLMYFCILAG